MPCGIGVVLYRIRMERGSGEQAPACAALIQPSATEDLMGGTREKSADPDAVARTAGNHFFFFWALFGLIIGTPSLLSIFQAVFLKRDFALPIQSMVDGWNDFTRTLADVVEPFVVPLFQWLGPVLGIELNLQPYWRHHFIVMAMLVIAIGRNAARTRAKKPYLTLAMRLCIVLLAALVAGALPLGEDRFSQAFLASILPWTLYGLIVAKMSGEIIIRFGLRQWWPALLLVAAPFLGFWIINTSAVMLLIPYLGAGAAIAALAASTLVVAALSALSTDGRPVLYSVGGGYVGAALLILADVAVT